MASGSIRSRRSFTTSINPFVLAQIQKLESYPRRDLPRYLFRCYSVEKSQGVNKPPHFSSAAKDNLSLHRRGCPLAPLSVVDIPTFASDARKHLTFNHDNDFRSPLVSFTSSLLVALGWARKRDLDGIHDLHIAIFDTQKIVSMHPIFPCTDLKDLVNAYLEGTAVVPGDCVDEFLAYDSVEVDASYACFQDLMAAELYTFIPELWPRAYYNGSWPRPTLKLRDQLFIQQKFVTESERQLLVKLCSKFRGEDYLLALAVHFLSLRGRPVETGTLLEVDAFALEQLQSFVGIDHEYNIGPGSFKVYKFASAGHGVTKSTAPELNLYSAFVDNMREELNIRQDEKLLKMSGMGIVETICNPADDALASLRRSLGSIIGPCDIGQGQLLTDARAARSKLEAALLTWRQMGISEILSDNIMADIRSRTETAKRSATSVRTQSTPTPCSSPELLGRQTSHGNMSVGRILAPRTNKTTSSGVFGSFLVSVDSPKKRKRTEGDENGDGGGEKKKSRKTL